MHVGSSGTTTELISVAEAIRRSSGKVGVKGLIIGIIVSDSGYKGDRI